MRISYLLIDKPVIEPKVDDLKEIRDMIRKLSSLLPEEGE